jgi:hypothetical protein
VTAGVTQTNPPNGEFFTGSAACPAGEVLLGGGFDADRLAGTFNVITSRPNSTASGWDVKLKIISPFGGTADFSSVFSGALDSWRRGQDEAREALAHSGFPSFLSGLAPHGPGGSGITPKESGKLQKAVRKEIAASDRAKRASLVLKAAIDDLKTPPTPPAQSPEALAEGVYALCGA